MYVQFERIKKGNKCYNMYKNTLSSKILSKTTKLRIYKTIIRPVVTYGAEVWTISEKDANQLRVFERKILRKIFGPTLNPDGTWHIKTNELDRLISQENIISI